MGTYIRELVPALSGADPSLEITLFHARFDPPPAGRTHPEPWMREYPEEELAAGIQRLYPAWALARRPPLPPGLASLDLVHSPTPAGIPPVAGRQRLVVTVHDLAFLVHPELFPRRWELMYRVALRRAVRGAHAIITVSRHTAEDLLRRTRVDPRIVRVVPNAASLPTSEVDVERTLARLKVPAPYLLYVGTLEPRKNLVRLVRAYRRVAARGLPHSLVLAGPLGWHSQPLMAELAARAPGEVVLTGSVGPGERDALYRGAAAFAYPSLYEGFGLPILEAMARGVPCVASTSSSLPEVVGEAALLVDPLSVAGLAEAVERVITDQALADRLREAGIARSARFSWQETARRTLDVYKSVL
jgi:glycosyltransferase involved in cell wall biosynthesis